MNEITTKRALIVYPENDPTGAYTENNPTDRRKIELLRQAGFTVDQMVVGELRALIEKVKEHAYQFFWFGSHGKSTGFRTGFDENGEINLENFEKYRPLFQHLDPSCVICIPACATPGEPNQIGPKIWEIAQRTVCYIEQNYGELYFNFAMPREDGNFEMHAYNSEGQDQTIIHEQSGEVRKFNPEESLRNFKRLADEFHFVTALQWHYSTGMKYFPKNKDQDYFRPSYLTYLKGLMSLENEKPEEGINLLTEAATEGETKAIFKLIELGHQKEEWIERAKVMWDRLDFSQLFLLEDLVDETDLKEKIQQRILYLAAH